MIKIIKQKQGDQKLPKNYGELVTALKSRIRAAQYEALKAVNKQLIELYWDIGKMIIEKQQGETWGKAVIRTLAKDLHIEFPGISGFSASNLWRIRLFYQRYSNSTKLAPLVRLIGWSQNIIILERTEDALEREFYLKMTKKFGWTKSVLINQIENRSYEKFLLNQNNFDQAVSEDIRNQAKLAIKDAYTFDFLELGEEHSEKELEVALIGKVERFLREMGGIFAFVGSQYRLEVEGNEYFIDLLLYHRHLKSLIALELKIGDFLPEYVGKMQFYLAVLDDKVRITGENSSIGIILCRTKNKVVVEYALKRSNSPIGVSTYTMTRALPKELFGQLPAPEQIAKLLDDVE